MSTIPIDFEPAAEQDIPALCDLLALLFAQEAEFTPDRAAQARGLAMIIGDPQVGAILVARAGPRVVGMVNLLFTVSTALGERVALLEDMVVAPSVRAHGVGAGLMQHALDFAREQGIRRITLLTDYDNEAAQRFYARQGFAASGMVPWRRGLE